METVIEEVYRSQSRRVLATLIRLLGDFDRAEEALHDAFAAAARQWPVDGLPGNPYAWLVSTGRFRAIDQLRRRARFDASQADIVDSLYPEGEMIESIDGNEIEDDMLRLIFTCCHPLLPRDAQMAMALREICGLTTEEIAHAFLVPAPTIAQRIVRAKSRIRTANLPYEVPDKAALPDRLGAVLHVIYLVFNEGYLASSGEELIRADLASEAIRLGRTLAGLLQHSEISGLLALMLLQDSRRFARTDAKGELILLSDQNRSLWNREMIREGLELADDVLRNGEIGPYTLQAAIAAEHARAARPEDTDWSRIADLYGRLLEIQRSPIVELNRAVAISMHEGPASGLRHVNAILERGDLQKYHLAHSARADFLRRLGRTEEARQAYETALILCHQASEQAFLRRRLAELAASKED
ncbi:RNA polymerase sigma factor [Rhizobium sp. BK376]|uniref:RNA polymerase sigma factor n=1 Tax=Rhizobium sp. BK376 TaxID=2512149 RepID=UPI00104E5C16|nr:RNA polymerase sigma factor [Rhizobium sp. BK376]TCR93119.1 RNA polymerase ECF family sigma subunit [Rhizobium sp. BK376]